MPELTRPPRSRPRPPAISGIDPGESARRFRRHIGNGTASGSPRSAVISLTTKIACSSIGEERRSPVSSRRRKTAACPGSPVASKARRTKRGRRSGIPPVAAELSLAAELRQPRLSQSGRREGGFVGGRADRSAGRRKLAAAPRRIPTRRFWRRRQERLGAVEGRASAIISASRPSAVVATRRTEALRAYGGQRRSGGNRKPDHVIEGDACASQRPLDKRLRGRRPAENQADGDGRRGPEQCPSRTEDPCRAGLRHPPRRIRTALRPDESIGTYLLRRRRERRRQAREG